MSIILTFKWKTFHNLILHFFFWWVFLILYFSYERTPCWNFLNGTISNSCNQFFQIYFSLMKHMIIFLKYGKIQKYVVTNLINMWYQFTMYMVTLHDYWIATTFKKFIITCFINEENFETPIWIMFDIQNQMPHITQISDLPRWYSKYTHKDLFQKRD